MSMPSTHSSESYEQLKLIMEAEQGQRVSLAEAVEYGNSLIKVYKSLAGDRKILGVNRQYEISESNFPTEYKKTRKGSSENNANANR